MTSDDERLYRTRGSRVVRCTLPTGGGGAAAAVEAQPPGVYEGVRTFGHTRFFGLRTHLERLADAARRFEGGLPFDAETTAAALDIVARDATRAFDAEARIRFDLVPDGEGGADLWFGVGPWRGVAPRVLRGGARLATAQGLARPTPEVKTAAFAAERRRWIAAQGRAGIDEYVLTGPGGSGDGSGGHAGDVVLEGALSNLALVGDGALHLAPSRVLPGVTMRAVCNLAEERGIEVRRSFVPVRDLARFDEAFFTTSVRGVVPVRSIDDVEYGAPGPITQALGSRYDALTADDARPAADRANGRY